MTTNRLVVWCVAVGVMTITVLNPQTAVAAYHVWNGHMGDGASTAWSTANNWTNTVPANGGTIQFTDHYKTNNWNNLSLSGITEIQFWLTRAKSYTIGGNIISLAAGGKVRNSTGVNQIVNLGFKLAGTTEFLCDGAGTLTFNGAIQAASAGTKTLTLNEHVTGGGSPIGGNITVNSAINNGGGVIALTKAGDNTAFLNGANNYTGATTVNAGTLQVDGSSVNSAHTVKSGATLAGKGTVGAVTVNSGGTISPGPTPTGVVGTLNTGALTLASGSTYRLDIKSNGTTADQIDVIGTVNLGGAKLGLGSKPTTVSANNLVIIRNDGTDSVTGTFAGFPEGSVVNAGSITYDITYQGDDLGAATGNDVILQAVKLDFIRQNNLPFPTTGSLACHMVSKYVTDVTLPDSATFAGPAGINPDPDTFRVQIARLASGKNPKIRLEVVRSGVMTYTHDFNMVYEEVAGVPTYRTDEHIRLVSNAPPALQPAGSLYDDEVRDHQTVLVKLADTVRATLVLDGVDRIKRELPVGRPPAEDGPNAIRTVDINFVTLQGVASAPATTVDRMSEDWAQIAVRFNLVSSSTVQPVSNVLSIRGTAGADGTLSVDITPNGGAATSITANIANGDTAEQMAAKLATAIDTDPTLSATHHHYKFGAVDRWLVLVNKGNEVAFAGIASTAPGVLFQEPTLDFNDNIDLLEGSVLGLNFMDDDVKTIDMIAVGDILINNTVAATGGDYLAADLPGWRNVSILAKQVIAGDDATYPTGAGHEMGHALFDDDDSAHVGNTSNLFTGSPVYANPETLTSPKRLTDAQNTDARTDSGPSTTPPLLQKK